MSLSTADPRRFTGSFVILVLAGLYGLLPGTPTPGDAVAEQLREWSLFVAQAFGATRVGDWLLGALVGSLAIPTALFGLAWGWRRLFLAQALGVWVAHAFVDASLFVAGRLASEPQPLLTTSQRLQGLREAGLADSVELVSALLFALGVVAFALALALPLLMRPRRGSDALPVDLREPPLVHPATPLPRRSAWTDR